MQPEPVEDQGWGRKGSNLRPRDYEHLGRLLNLAMGCQHLYIETVLGVSPTPEPDPDGGEMAEQPVVCMWCGRAGHAMADCPDLVEEPY